MPASVARYAAACSGSLLTPKRPSRNVQQSGGSMPLFTVTMKSNESTNEKDRLSRAIHAASIAAGYPEDDLFQRFLFLGPSGLRVDLYYPALPKPRTDQMLMIEVLVSSGTDTNRKKGLVVAQVQKLGEAGIDPNDIMVFFLETDRASGSFGGGRLAAPCLRLITAHGILAEWSRGLPPSQLGAPPRETPPLLCADCAVQRM